MKSLSFFKTATFFLLLLNLGLIFFLFQGRPKRHHHPRGAFHQEAIKILELDATQRDEFRDLVKTHSQAIEVLNAERSTILTPYFNNLFSESSPVKQDSLMLRFQAIEKKKVEITRDHFQEVKKMLKPEQEQHLDLFLKRAVNILLLDKKSGRKPRK